MTRHVLLNNVAHKDLRIITRYSAALGHSVASALIFPTEFGDIQREYPIFFRQDPATGEFMSVALLGFSPDENLFLDGSSWNAGYVPGVIARGPFLIGFQDQRVEGQQRREAVIHVDLDDPRISTTEGEPLFLPQGGHTRYLERMADILRGLNDGMAIAKAMFAAFNELKLIEPVKVQIKLGPEEQYELVGMHTLSEEKLAALEGEPLTKLHKSGFLHGAYLVLASLNNVSRLVERKQALRRAQAEKSGA
jgi:SapC